jgi:signal transduction histidine kinase
MTVTPIRLDRSARLWRLAPRSARLRLTLIYSGGFLILGTVIVVAIFAFGSGQSSVSVAASSSGAATASAGASAAHAAATQQHSADVSRLLASAWITLLLTALVSAPLGWFVAGWVLRPLRQMRLATQAISAGSLHQRLALTGAEDEFRQLGDTIDDLLSRLESSFAAQRRFVANAAHELRTPLTVERALLQVALSDPQVDTAKLQATCEELIASGREQERLLDALLTLATSERGLDRRDVIDLASVIQTALAGASAAADGLEVTTELEPVLISGDRALIERLVHNLIDNAIGYNRPGGRIEVRTESLPAGALLTVTNTGQRIPPEQVDRLFEPFRRLDSDRTASDGHHGLGLSIVRAVARAHQGEVTAAPVPGGGLTVTVTFPPLPA